MDRREFLRFSLTLSTSWTINNLLSSCVYPPPIATVDKSVLKGIQIIDAHAHPDRFHHVRPAKKDESSTLEKIITMGMKASVFAAVGDLPFFSPPQTTSYYRSTKNQLSRVQKLAEDRKVRLITKASALSILPKNNYLPGAIMAIEGGNPLEGKVDRVAEFYQLGVRIITLVHFTNNELGDIMKPWRNKDPGAYNKGLTKAGRKVIEEMQRLGIVVDVAHAHPQTLKEIIEMNPAPLLDSHTNPCPVADHKKCGRMRTWKDMELIAQTGGVICTWPYAYYRADYKRRTFLDWAQEILEMKKRVGIEHVGLGTDGGGNLPRFIDGYRDIGDLPKLVKAMQTVGLTPEDIKAYMGGNFYRLLQKCIS